MAIYRCEAKAISRGQGRSCVAAAAYRHAATLRDERQQLTHGYERKEGVVHSEIVAPDDAPDWARDREALWNHLDAAERRKDAMTAREVLVALPRELDHAQRVEAVRDFVREEFTARGIVADMAVHEPAARDGDGQPHAHVMVADRALDPGRPNGLAAGKDRTLAQAPGVEALRERWEHACNRALERAGVPERVDRRSLADRHREAATAAADPARPPAERDAARDAALLLDRPPEPKIGPVALRMERQGRGDEAYALRDALAVRRDRTAMARLVEGWRQVRDQALNLGRAVADQARQAADRLRETAGQLLPSPALAGSLGRLRAAGAELARQDRLAEPLRRAGAGLERDDHEREQREQRRRDRERSRGGGRGL